MENAPKEETKAGKEETEALKKETRTLTEEVTMLRPFKETAVDIRKRFFATFRRREGGQENEDPSTIDSGNQRAHAGDVCLDVCLFRHHLIECDDNFSTLYGLSWPEAEALLGMLCYSFRSPMTICISNRDRH